MEFFDLLVLLDGGSHCWDVGTMWVNFILERGTRTRYNARTKITK